MSSLTRQRIYFIGYNHSCEFGLGHHWVYDKLTPCTNKMISKIFSGYLYNIFTDDNLDNIWAAGTNSNGECGLRKTK